MPRQRCRLLGDAFHQVAVAAQGIGVMIDDRVSGTVVTRREPRLRDGESDAVGEALTQRSRGHFYAGGIQPLGMTWSLAAPLSEALDFIQREIVSGKKQQAVQKHGTVSGRKDE